MNTSNIIFLIAAFLTLLIGGIWLFLYLRKKRHNASFPVRIKEIKTQKQRGNPYLYQYMRSINLDFFKFGGGKIAFRRLPQLMQRGVYLTEEYNEYLSFLSGEA